MIKSNYIISTHAKERIKSRGIKQAQFIKRDLAFMNVKQMITTKEGYQIRYTKSNLKIVLKGNKVITVYKIRANDIKRDIEKYRR